MTALQTEYIKSQIATLTEQAKELSQQATKIDRHWHRNLTERAF